MSWNDDPIIQSANVAAAQPPGWWDSDPIVSPAPARPPTPVGALESIQAGLQGSALGLAWTGKLPSLLVDPHVNNWWEQGLSSLAHVAGELPLMIPAAAAGGIAGSAAGGPVGALLGAGFAMGVVPAAVRTALMEGYKSKAIESVPDFWHTLREVAKASVLEGGINAAAMGMGALAKAGIALRTGASGEAAKAIGLGQASLINRGTQTAAVGADLATQLATMVTVPAAFEGRLPEWHEIRNGAIVIGGMKFAHVAGTKLINIYERTGRTPAEVVTDVQADPKIAEEMVTPEPAGDYRPSEVLRIQESLFRETDRLSEIEAKAVDARTEAEAAEVPALRARIAELESRLKAANDAPPEPGMPATYTSDQIIEARAKADARLAELTAKAGVEPLTDMERAERTFLANNRANPEALARHFNIEPERPAAVSREAFDASAKQVYDDALANIREAYDSREAAGLYVPKAGNAEAVATILMREAQIEAAMHGRLPWEIWQERGLRVRDSSQEAEAAAEAAIPPDAPRFTPPEVDLFGNPIQVTSAPRMAVENLATVEVPIANLVLSKEVPQFKHAADAAGVVVPLGGKFDRTGVGPIQVWERLDGTLEVISGRHRLDLARRSGEETIPAQVHREADGFDVRQAAMLDAELNIREEQGSVADYAQYFKDSGKTREAAELDGLLARAKGKAGFAIARDGSADLLAAHRAGILSDEAALSISGAAPGSDRLQALGIRMVNEGKSILVAVNTMRAVDLMASERMAAGTQGDIFGFDDSAMREATAMAKKASSKQRQISEQISAVSGASKRPEIARKLGVDVQDPEGVQKKILELKQEQYLWDNWPLYPELVAKLRGENLNQGAPDIRSPELLNWFGDSKITDQEGKPKVLMHSTNDAWDTFDPKQTLSSFGFHAGTVEQAEAVQFTGGTKADLTKARPLDGLNIMPVYLKITNPLRMTDKGAWYPFEMVEELAKLGITDKTPLPANAREAAGFGARHMDITWGNKTDARKKWDLAVRKQFEKWLAEHQDASRDQMDYARMEIGRDYVRDLIEKAGYDGIVYDNKYEGGGDSWIAFRPEQIKSAIGNRGTYDPNDPNILHQAANAETTTKVVDEEGTPKVVYRGVSGPVDYAPNAVNWFTENPTYASNWATGNRYQIGNEAVFPHGARVLPAFLDIKKPFDADANYKDLPGGLPDTAFYDEAFVKDLKAQGYDGAFWTEYIGPNDTTGYRNWVTFEPNQIKTAIGGKLAAPEEFELKPETPAEAKARDQEAAAAARRKIQQDAIADKQGKPFTVDQIDLFNPQGTLFQRAIPGPNSPGVGITNDNKLGLWRPLRVRAPAGLTIPEKPLILQETKNINAARQVAALDGILDAHPDASASIENWATMTAQAFASRDVPIPPYAFIRDINGPGAIEKLRSLHEGQIADADHGFRNAAEFRRAYTAGELDVTTTGKLFMWSFLSRGVSPYTQESLFIDAFNGADAWIQKAAAGRFTEADFGPYEEWAKSVAPKGSGQPGAGAAHNLNAFGKHFLFKMGKQDQDGKSHLQKLHDMMADPNQTGASIRREFVKFGEGVGIDNKVVSFTLLVAGHNDVMVLDRVQIRNLWDDGRFSDVNLYDGVNNADGMRITGSGLADLTTGARGLLYYEAIERGLASKLPAIYAAVGRPQDASLGRYHWDTWVAASEQEAAHGTLGAILADAKGNDTAIASVSAKQGEYAAYEYGAMYNRNAQGEPGFRYSTPTGKTYEFSVPAFRAFLDAVRDPKTGVVPKGFLLRGGGNAPWYDRPEVNKAKLDETATYWADRAGGSGEGRRVATEAIEAAAAADRQRSRSDELTFQDDGNPNVLFQSDRDNWYFSALNRSIEAASMKVAPASGWRDFLKGQINKGAVKQAELEAVGIEEWLGLQEGKVTKEQVQAYLKANGVQVTEEVLGGPALAKSNLDRNLLIRQNMDDGMDRVEAERLADEIIADDTEAALGDPERQYGTTEPRFSEYQLSGSVPGSYREIVLTLPPAANVQKGWVIKSPDGIGSEWFASETDARRIAKERGGWAVWEAAPRENAKQSGEFQSTHFPNAGNYLAHTRVNDRVLPDGRKVLFVEEIQNDLAQSARKYRNSLVDAMVKATGITKEEAKKRIPSDIAFADEIVPSSPFQKQTDAWTALVLKRLLRYAAEGGYDAIAWTRGEQQVERYTNALRNAVDVIEWKKTPEGVHLVGYKGREGHFAVSKDTRRNRWFIKNMDTGEMTGLGYASEAEAKARLPTWVRNKVVDTTEKESVLSDAIGKAMADRIRNDPNQSGTIEGENITVSDTGMAGFYDRIVPSVAKEVLKKIGGGKVGEIKFGGTDPDFTIKQNSDGTWAVYNGAGDLLAERDELTGRPFRTERQARQALIDDGMEAPFSGTQPMIEITPEMRDKIMAGLPLFQRQQGNLGSYSVADRIATLFESANESTLIHEVGHHFLENLKFYATRPNAPARVLEMWDTARREFAIGTEGRISEASHEHFARAWERYIGEGEAPTPGLAGIFKQFKDWFIQIYNDLRNIPTSKISPEIRALFDRILATDEEIAAANEMGIPRAYVPLANVEKAVRIVPPPEAKKPLRPGPIDEQLAAKPFAEESLMGPGSGPGRDSRVNAKYINGPDDLKLAIQQVAHLDQENIQAKRGGTNGTKTWEQANAEADKLIEDTMGGRMVDSGPDTGIPHDVRQRAAYKVMLAVAKYSLQLRDTVLEKGQNATVQDQFDYLSSIVRMRMAHAEFLGLRAASARAMNQIRDMTPDSGIIEKMVEQTGGRELFQAAKTAAEEAAEIKIKLEQIMAQHFSGKGALDIAKLHKDMNSLKGALKFSKEVTEATKWEMVVEGWKAGLLSGPVTHTTNLFGTGAFQALRTPVEALAIIIGIARGASPGMGESDRASMSEATARITGMLGGMLDGLTVAWHTFKQDVSSGKTESYREAIPGRAGQIIRTPLRMMAAEDALIGTMYERGEIKTLAIRQAFDENLNPGTREFAERVQALTDKPTAAMTAAATAARDRMTFNMPLGEKGVALQLFVAKWNLQWMIPFIRTPINIAKELARMSPFAPIVGEWRADIAKGGVARDRALAEITIGTGIMAVTMAYAFAGNISGAGSPDPGKNRGKAGVWQPYSILIGDTWYEYSRIQPTGTLMGLAADIANVWDHMTDEEKDKIPKMLAVAFSNAVTNQTFLQGITNFVNATSDPTRFGPRFMQQLVGSVVPNIIGQPTTMADPVVREVNSMLEAVQARIPGLRQDLLPKRDWLGEPVQTKERLGIVLPVREQNVSNDKVRLEAARLDISMAAAPKKTHIGKGTGKLGQVEFTPEERDKFAEVGGKFAHEILSSIVNAPGYDKIPDLIQKRIFAKVLTESHKLAAVMAMPIEKRIEYIQNITERVAQELAPAEEQ